MIAKSKLKKGDKVIVLAGKDKGKTGSVERVLSKTAQVVVSGVNQVKKHVKVSKKYPTGGIADVVKPISSGKVALLCPSCNKPTRIGFETKGKEKNRVCKKCGKVIGKAKSEVKEK